MRKLIPTQMKIEFQFLAAVYRGAPKSSSGFLIGLTGLLFASSHIISLASIALICACMVILFRSRKSILPHVEEVRTKLKAAGEIPA